MWTNYSDLDDYSSSYYFSGYVTGNLNTYNHYQSYKSTRKIISDLLKDKKKLSDKKVNYKVVKFIGSNNFTTKSKIKKIIKKGKRIK